MNKIKKLVSLTLVISLLILSSLTVLAVNSNGDYIGVEVSSDTVKVGETVQAWVYAYDNDGDAVITTKESATIYMTFDKAGFEVKEVKYVAGAGEKLTTNADNIKYLGMGLSADVSLAKSAKFMLVEFTALKEGTYNFSILEESGQGEILYWNAGDLLEDTDGEILPAVSVTVKAATPANPAEEIFDKDNLPSAAKPTVETITGKDADGKDASLVVTSAAKQVAVFGKAPSVLEKGKYGIIFGGKTFAGAADLKAGDKWVIKLIAPNGMLGENSDDKADFAGKYAVTIFNGEATFEAGTVTVE